ncbi:MAG: HAD-IA family hydrolase [Acidobacteriota bacterium]
MSSTPSPSIGLPYELLIFDWDGTLIDSIGSIVACTMAALDELGLERLPESAVRATVGLGLKETMDALMPQAEEALRNELREAYFRHWVATYHAQPMLFPGVDEALTELSEAGYLLAVATGKSRRGLERDLDRVAGGELRRHFVGTRTVDEARSKPDPQMVFDLLKELGMRSDRSLMIGDTSYDLLMARSAGMASLGVTTGSHDREELNRYEPVACLDAATELPSWLRSLPVSAGQS